jgi:DNA repair exonuclease SbcCD ATPase subunit
MNAPEGKKINYMEIEETNTSLPQGIKHQMSGIEAVETGSLDKIRDILFGNQMRENEKRFARLEEGLVKEQSDLREDIKKRLDNLENYIRREIDSLTDRVDREPTARDKAVKDLEREIKNLIDALDNKITQLQQQANQSQRELRQQILDQSKNIEDGIKQKNEEILAVLEQETERLRRDKTERSYLAALFAELAVRLNKQ